MGMGWGWGGDGVGYASRLSCVLAHEDAADACKFLEGFGHFVEVGLKCWKKTIVAGEVLKT